MTTEITPSEWGKWLQEKLEERGRRQADLAKNSEGLIKRDRASKWVRGVEAPTWRMAKVAANTLGVPQAEALRAAGFVDAANDMERRRNKLDEHLYPTPSQGQLIEVLKSVPDSEILRILQLRAEQRESINQQAVGVAQGNLSALNVSGLGETTEPRQSDYRRAAKPRSKNRGEDFGE